uniref:hypothetical protein n=1 Tax=Gemmiger formicilis TaxID=745368 RepID=UPI0040262FCE
NMVRRRAPRFKRKGSEQANGLYRQGAGRRGRRPLQRGQIRISNHAAAGGVPDLLFIIFYLLFIYQ